MGWLAPGYGREKCHFVTVSNRPDRGRPYSLLMATNISSSGDSPLTALPDIASGRDTVGLDGHGRVANALTQTGEESDVNGHGSRINSQADTTVCGSIIGAENAGHKQR